MRKPPERRHVGSLAPVSLLFNVYKLLPRHDIGIQHERDVDNALGIFRDWFQAAVCWAGGSSAASAL